MPVARCDAILTISIHVTASNNGAKRMSDADTMTRPVVALPPNPPGTVTDDTHRRALELVEGAMRLVTMNDRRAAEQFRGIVRVAMAAAESVDKGKPVNRVLSQMLERVENTLKLMDSTGG